MFCVSGIVPGRFGGGSFWRRAVVGFPQGRAVRGVLYREVTVQEYG